MVLMPPLPHGAPPSELSLFPHVLDQVMGNAFVHNYIIRRGEDVSFIRRLVETAMSTDRLDGVVTVSRTREVYEYLAGTGVPVVLLGKLESEMPDIPTVDLDYHESGRLLAEHIVKKGHRNVVVQLFASTGSDHHFADAIAEVMSDAKLPSRSLKLRTFSGDLETAQANFRDLLTKKKDRPTAAIARGEMLANAATLAARDIGIPVGKEFEIVWSANALKMDAHSPYVHVQPSLNMAEVALLVAQMLEDQREGRPIEKRHVLIPAVLCDPSAGQ